MRKTLGQVLLEVSQTIALRSWSELEESTKEEFNMRAQAVIAEWQRRNGEPVAWVQEWPNGLVDFWKEKPSLDIIGDTKPLYTSPQPAQLPSMEEIAKVICAAADCADDMKFFNNAAQAVLGLLKGWRNHETRRKSTPL